MSEWTNCPKCGTLMENLCACPKCEPATADAEPCDHDWHFEDDSFDHEYGTEVIRYFLCEKCGATKPTCSADFGSPEP
jgi:hypothetical protein